MSNKIQTYLGRVIYVHIGRVMFGVWPRPKDWMLKYTRWPNRRDFEIGPFQVWIRDKNDQR